MEEYILKILEDNTEEDYRGNEPDFVNKGSAAEEIVSHIKEFHDWLTQDNTPNAFEKNYKYWKENIKNK